MVRLPNRNADLLRYVRRRRALRFLLLFLWTAFFALAALYFNRTHRFSIIPRLVGWRLWVWIAGAVVIGFFLFRIPSLFLDRSFEGEIVRSSLSHSYSAAAGANVSAAYQFRLNTVLRIQTPDGKLRKLKFEQKQGFYFYYHEGNYIRYFSGLPFPIADPSRMTAPPRQKWRADEDSTGDVVSNPQKSYLCAVCGHFYPTPTRCENCGHSLIDPKDLFGK
ncbi:MAG: hypothetical protein E7680_02985 [Ruminococcaceae bacterium]|nr:hypothetical protein [Oscillospiraceae bacterium]